MFKRLTATVLSLAIIFSALSPVAYATDIAQFSETTEEVQSEELDFEDVLTENDILTENNHFGEEQETDSESDNENSEDKSDAEEAEDVSEEIPNEEILGEEFSDEENSQADSYLDEEHQTEEEPEEDVLQEIQQNNAESENNQEEQQNNVQIEEFIEEYSAIEELDETTFSFENYDLPDNDQLFEGFVDGAFYGNNISVFGTAAREKLNIEEKVVYDSLKAAIEKIAAEGGSTEISVTDIESMDIKYIWTREELGVTSIEGTAVNEAAQQFMQQVNTNRIMDALLHDCPYDLYWFDKTVGMKVSCSYVSSYYPSKPDEYVTMTFKSINFKLSAAENYQGSNIYEVTPQVSKVKTAVENANAIAEKHKSLKDYDKLTAFKDEICQLVEYDSDAALTGGFTHNDDPWQLISVFDNDADTNVVCEGYSKAFQYLCDISNFKKAECYTVSGTMNGGTGAGGHMWNIVTMEDGKNYLADITNTDKGTIGQYGGLFLAGAQGSAETSYTATINGRDIVYTYNPDMFELWGSKMLTLADADYVYIDTEEEIIWRTEDTDGDDIQDTLFVGGIGEMDAYDEENPAPWSSNSATVKKVIIGADVEKITADAFAGFESVEELMLLNGKAIADAEAFKEFVSLKTVYFTGTYSQWEEYSVLDNLNSANVVFADICGESSVYYLEDRDEDDENTTETLVITGIGSTFNWQSQYNAPWSDSRNIFTTVIIESGIKELGGWSFTSHSKLKEAYLPDTLETIGERAFSICGLTEVIIPDSVKTIGKNAFRENFELENIVIGNNVETIEDGAFAGNGKVESITVPDSVTYIGSEAFAYSGLKTIKLPAGLTMLNHQLLRSCKNLVSFEIPEGITYIGNLVFADCSYLVEITIPSTVAEVEETVFGESNVVKTVNYNGSAQHWFENLNKSFKLAYDLDYHFTGGNIAYEKTAQNEYMLVYWDDAQGDITIPATYNDIPVTSIREKVFYNNKDITSVVISENIKSIGAQAFSGCTNLKQITLPVSLTDVGDNAFKGCSSLELIKYNGSSQQWVDNLFEDKDIPEGIGLEFAEDGFAFVEMVDRYGQPMGECRLLYTNNISGDVFIPSSYNGMPVTDIGAGAFEGNTDITSVYIPFGINTINENAFKGCTNIKYVYIPDTYLFPMLIYKDAFAGCNSLEKVVHPSIYNWQDISRRFEEGNEALLEAELEYETKFGYKLFYNEDIGYFDAYITGIYGFVEKLVIPAQLMGFKVKGIEGYNIWGERIKAFENKVGLNIVVISEGIETIDLNAFDGNTKLREIVIPSTFTEIMPDNKEDAEHAFIGVPRDDKECVVYVTNSLDYSYFNTRLGFENVKYFTALEGISAKDVKVTLDKSAVATPTISKLPNKDAYATLDIQWTVESGYEDIVQIVTENGIQKIKPVSVGEAIIKATDKKSGFTAYSTVNVVLPSKENMKVEVDTDLCEPIDSIGLEYDDTRILKVSSKTAGAISGEKLDVKSSSSAVEVYVDEDGYVTVKSANTTSKAVTATITVSLKNDSSEKATFKVKAISKQVHEVLVVMPEISSNGLNATVIETEYGYSVIIPREMVKDQALTFEIGGAFDAEAFEQVGTAVPGVTWATTSKAIAAVSDLKPSQGYKAKITVAKNANGTATITATSKDLKKAQTSIDIDVRDYTPRLETSAVTLNTYKEEGVSVKLYTAYDAYLENYNEEMAMLLAEGEEEINVRLAGNDNFYAVYDKENKAIVINAREIAANNSKGHKLTLMIKTSKGMTEQTVTVKVANKLPTVTVKQSGTFNSFYKDSSVFTAVTAKDAVVKDVVIKDTPTFTAEFVPAAEATEDTAAQSSGISVSWADKNDPAEGYIKNSKKQMVADTSAKLDVYFEGYRQAATVSYTVKAAETKPTLSQSSSTTKYTYLNMTNTPLNITKKVKGEADEVIEFAQEGQLGYHLTASNHAGEGYKYVEVAVNGRDVSLTPVLEEDNKMYKDATSRKVSLAVQHDNWVKAITVSHTVSVDIKKPTVSTKNTTVTLRALYDDRMEVLFTPNIANCPVPVSYAVVNAAKVNTDAYTQAEKISIEKNGDNGWKLNVGFKDVTDIPKAGTYSFKITPTVKNAAEEDVALNTVTVKVKVDGTKPTVSTKNTKVTLRTMYDDKVEMLFTPNKADCPMPQFRFESTAKANSDALVQAGKISFKADETNGWKVYAEVNDYSIKAGTYSYKVTPIVKDAAGNDVELKAVTVQITVSTANPTVSVKPTSVTLNAATSADSAVIKVTPSDSECPKPIRYDIVPNTTKKATVEQAKKVEFTSDGWDITAGFADLNDIPNNGSYSYKLTAYIKDKNDADVALKTVTFTVKVATTAPKVTFSKTSVTLNQKITEDYVIEPSVNAGYRIVSMDISTTNATAKEKLSMVYHDGVVKAEVKDSSIKNGTYSYTVTTKVLMDKEGVTVPAEVKQTIKIVTKGGTASFKTSASGSIDLAVREKGITYTITGGNYFNYSKAEAAKAAENIRLTGTYMDGLVSKDINELFEVKAIEPDSKGQPRVVVTAKADAPIKNSTTYKYKLEAEVEGIGKVVSSAFSVKTKQSTLKFKVSGDTTVYHKHENGILTVTLTSPAAAKIDSIEVLDTKATTVPKGAMSFETEENADGSWTVSYRILRSSKLAVNKSYKLALAVTPQGNASNKAAQTVTVTLKVKR